MMRTVRRRPATARHAFRFAGMMAAALWLALSTPRALALAEHDQPATSAQSYLSRSQAAKLRDQIAAIPPDTRKTFARRYQAWRRTWSSPSVAVLSSTAALRRSEEFAALGAMGSQILPLLIDKIARPDEFFALQTYEALQGDVPARIGAAGEPIFESEQAKAKRAVKDWLAR
jgi:hypothetical protein